jgi:hypothetical protein
MARRFGDRPAGFWLGNRFSSEAASVGRVDHGQAVAGAPDIVEIPLPGGHACPQSDGIGL